MSRPPLTISVFGPLRVLVEGEPLPRVRTRSIEWLLALLVLRQGRAVDRSWLAGTLWPDSSESQALHNLRDALVHLRKALGREGARIQSPTRDTLTLALEGAEVDVVCFDAAMQAGDEASLQRAVALYTGPLLEGCYEPWVSLERENRDQACLTALESLADRATERADYAAAIRYLRQAEKLDPLRDTTARRLMTALQVTGDTAAAIEVYRRLRLRLHEELSAAPDEATTRLFQQIRAQSRPRTVYKTEAPGTLTPSVPVSPSLAPVSPLIQPPRPLTRLIGRKQEVQDIQDRLRQSRLVTLIGAGGVGKTRLALEVAALAGEEFEGRVAWVELASLAEDDLLLPILATALGVWQEGAGDATVLQSQVVSQLSGSPFLLALDNCEHLIDAASGIVEGLLSRCVDLRVLATSRQRFGLTGEIVWRVPPLSMPESSEMSNCVLNSPAVRLFIERAESAQPGFQLADSEDIQAVWTICKRLDGIPLAIELAAARIGPLSLQQIADRLDDRFRLLTRGSRAALPRHRTLKALVDWSYNLLSPDEQKLLQRLSVFVGGWTLEAAEAVCGADGNEVLDLLTWLTDRSLVIAEARGRETRYRMLETIREYALEALRAAGEEEEARRKHLACMVELAESAGREVLHSQSDAALARIERELDNIRAALGWVNRDAVYPDLQLRLAAALGPFFELRGLPNEGYEYLRVVLRRPDLPDSPARAHALLGVAMEAFDQSKWRLAIDCMQESLDRFRVLDDVPGTAAALLFLSHLALRLNDIDNTVPGLPSYEAVRAMLKEGLALCRSLGWVQASAVVLIHLGLMAKIEGDMGQSKLLLKEGWDLLDKAEDGRTPTFYLNILNSHATLLYARAGDRALLERSLTLARKTNRKRRMAAILKALSEVAAQQGDSALALTCLLEEIQLHRETGNDNELISALQKQGNYYYRLRDYRAACAAYTESLALVRKLGYQVQMAANNLGSTLFHLGEPERARQLHLEALPSYGDGLEGITWSLERLAVVKAFYGEPSRAARLLGAAANARQALGGSMAEWDQKDWDDAVAAVRSALGDQEFDRLFEAAMATSWRQVVDNLLHRG